MADIVIKQPSDIRKGLSLLGEGYRQLRGVGAFNGTDASGTLIVPGFTKVEHVQLVPLDVPKTIFSGVPLTLGTISASAVHTITVPKAGTIVAAYWTTKDAITPSDTDYWSWDLRNKTQNSNIVIDGTGATNSTQATGGFALVAYTPKLLTLTSANVAVGANDVLEFTVSKHNSAANMTESNFRLDIDIGGTDETLYVTANSDGTIPISSSKITIRRTGNAKTSGLKFAFTVTGR